MLNTNLLEDFRNFKNFLFSPHKLIDIIFNGVGKMKSAYKKKEKKRCHLIQKSFQNYFY